MTPQQQEQFHNMTILGIRNRAWAIKQDLDRKFDQAMFEMGLSTLRSIGYRTLGSGPFFEFFECTKCGTTYRKIDGALRCNGQLITKCLCQGDDLNGW